MSETAAAGSKVSPNRQTDYQESAYADTRWNVIGEFGKNDTFTPMPVQILASDHKKMMDPMFADYGGLSGAEPGKVWSIADREKEARKTAESSRQPENQVVMTPEELEQKLGEAFEAGKEMGLAESVEANNQKLGQLETRIKSVIVDLGKQVNEHLQQIQRNALDLSLNISKKIINFAVEINPEYISSIITEAIAQSGSAQIKRVRVSPEDMEFITVVGVANDIKGFDGTWGFEADPGIKTGCVLDTSAGEVDFQLDKAWERVRDMVVKVTRNG